MATTVARPSYNDIIFSVKQNLHSDDQLSGLAYEIMKVWILEAQERITRRVTIGETRTLRLIQGQEDYPFQDTAIPVGPPAGVAGTGNVSTVGITLTGQVSAGTGTITTSGVNVTGVGSTFISQLKVGNYFIVGSQAQRIVKINSQTSLTIGAALSSDLLVATAYNYSTTRFTQELVSGSVIVSNAQTWTVDTITDGYNATLKTPNTTEATNNTFTIDTVVTEIPTRMMNLIETDRIESTFHRQPLIKDIGYLLSLRKNDLINIYSQYNTPWVISVYRNGSGLYFLKVYSQSDQDKEMTLYANVRIMPRFYIADLLTASIQLSEDYEYAIRMYLESMTYGWLKDRTMEKARMADFETEITRLNARYIPLRSLKIVYQ